MSAILLLVVPPAMVAILQWQFLPVIRFLKHPKAYMGFVPNKPTKVPAMPQGAAEWEKATGTTWIPHLLNTSRCHPRLRRAPEMLAARLRIIAMNNHNLLHFLFADIASSLKIFWLLTKCTSQADHSFVCNFLKPWIYDSSMRNSPHIGAIDIV